MTAAAPAASAIAPRGWAALWHGWRDRLLLDARFQRWVARTPMLRSVARRHAADLFGLCSGFVHSQVLYASVRLGLLEALRAGDMPLGELQQRSGLPPARAALLIQATDALGLTEPRGAGERRGLGLLGAALLGNPAVLRMVEHQPLFYRDLLDPLALLQAPAPPGALASFWGYSGNPSAAALPNASIESYTALMAETQSLVAAEVLGAYPFARHRCLLDVGGGDGSFLRALARRVPRLRLMLFDLPAVAESARTRLAAAGLAERVQTHGGDFSQADLPSGADVVTLVRVVHDHDDHAVLQLLGRVRQALAPGGRVVIAEPMRAVAGSLPAADIYLGFYLLAMGQGRVRSSTELRELLGASGFGSARLYPTARPWQCAVMAATATSKSVRFT
jgi:demethylspheroidene O-methyltransferase